MARVQGTGFALYSFRSIKRCNKLQSEILSKAEQMECEIWESKKKSDNQEVLVKWLPKRILEYSEVHVLTRIYRKHFYKDLNEAESKLKGMKESLAMLEAKMAEVVPGEESGDMTKKEWRAKYIDLQEVENECNSFETTALKICNDWCGNKENWDATFE
ncbi:unnamed protein product [Orchesella dallaii]|uniref:Uncharacterized protein n=1 Tax=Orchesella dallaii TaxID=48710 RepID=A0ABP1PWT7_9HEXA